METGGPHRQHFCLIAGMEDNMEKKMMWKAAACAAAVLGMALVAGCGGGDKPAASSAAGAAQGKLMQKIKQQGKIIVGTASGYPPYEFIDTKAGEKKVIGIDMEIAQKLADKLGVKLEVQDMNFQALLASMASGKVDIAIAGINPTDERRKTMDFSDDYMPTEQKILVRKADAAKYKQLSDFDGKTIGVQKSTTQENLAKTEIKNAQLVSLAHVPEAILELKQGKVDGVVVEGIGGKQFLVYNDDLTFAEGVHFKNGTKSSGAAMQKGNEDLKKVVNEVLKENTDNGNMKKWEEEYIKKAVDNAK